MESPPPPMATGKFGMFTASALRCLKTAFNGRKEFTSRDVDLVEPLLPLATIRVPWKDHNPAVFGIHKNILEHCSLFFKVLFARDVESPGSPIVQCEHAMTRVTELEASVVAFRIYAELRIQNAIVDFLVETIIIQRKIDLTLPTLIFDKTSVTSPLRRLLVDLYVLYGHKDWMKLDGSSESISATFLSDLSTAFLARNSHDSSPTTNESIPNGCRYHEHPEGTLCPLTKSHPREVVEQKR
ncbi:hypothetical protein KCU62_g1324, partial [Aureobasidium sp. EXF-3399]